MIELKDWLNSINQTKEDLTLEDPLAIKKYPPFIINKCLSAHYDCIMFVNEMNINHHLDKVLQNQFYQNSLRRKKRYSPWLRKDKVKNLDVVKIHKSLNN